MTKKCLKTLEKCLPWSSQLWPEGLPQHSRAASWRWLRLVELPRQVSCCSLHHSLPVHMGCWEEWAYRACHTVPYWWLYLQHWAYGDQKIPTTKRCWAGVFSRLKQSPISEPHSNSAPNFVSKVHTKSYQQGLHPSLLVFLDSLPPNSTLLT